MALSAAALLPVVGTLAGWIRSRRLDAIAVVSLVFIAVGMTVSLISGDPRFLLLKESLTTAAFGLVCFGSLLLPRPLLFYFGRQFSSMGDPEAMARFDLGWQKPYFRFVIRVMTIVWGSGYLAEALLRVLLQSILPIPVYLVVSQLLMLGVTAGLIAWTISYGNRARRRSLAQDKPVGTAL
jgi:intracellular septation protein A